MTSNPGVRDPRIAVLVYNDAANDSRVLKESASLRDEGYQVRIIAVERRELGRAAQTTELREGLCLQRVPEFTIERILPALAPLWRHLIRHEAVAEPAAGPPAPGPLRPGAPLASTRARVLRGLRNVCERAYRTLALGTYWVNAARAGDRKSTRLNSSHVAISYAVFCLQKKKTINSIFVVSCSFCIYFLFLRFQFHFPLLSFPTRRSSDLGRPARPRAPASRGTACEHPCARAARPAQCRRTRLPHARARHLLGQRRPGRSRLRAGRGARQRRQHAGPGPGDPCPVPHPGGHHLRLP